MEAYNKTSNRTRTDRRTTGDGEQKVSSVLWRVNVRTHCYLLAAAWQMYWRPIMYCCKHAA